VNTEKALHVALGPDADPKVLTALRHLLNNVSEDAATKAIKQEREFVVQVIRSLPVLPGSLKQMYIESPEYLKEAFGELVPKDMIPGTLEYIAESLRFNALAKAVLESAKQEAWRTNCGFVGTEHLLLGILRMRTTTAFKVIFDGHEVNLDALRDRVELLTSSGTSPWKEGKYPSPTPRVKMILSAAREERDKKNGATAQVQTADILLAILSEEAGIAFQALSAFDVTYDSACQKMSDLSEV
jgi:hypothetical protein